MTIVPLTDTRAKLPRSISILATSDLLGIDFANANNSAVLAALGTKPTKIGAIERIEINQTIELKEWREFDPDQGGQVVEWCPGKEEISFTLEGIITYDPGDVLDQLYPPNAEIPNGIESMLMMKSGFTIEIRERRYSNGVEQHRATYLLGCRLSSHPISINIGTADIIKQACEGKAARLMRTSWQ